MNIRPSLYQAQLVGEIRAESVGYVLAAIQTASRAGQAVQLWICSLGGDLMAGLAIHDALARNEHNEAVATGDCQSAALVAFLGAPRRLATPNTLFLNHGIAGARGEAWPRHLSFATLETIGKYPKGFFGVETAQQHKIIHGVLRGIGEWTPALPISAPADLQEAPK